VTSFRARLRPGALPLVPLAPTVVVLVGVAVAMMMMAFGLVQLRLTSDDGASEKARVLSRALSLRLRSVAFEDRTEAVAQTARRTGVDLMLVDVDGRVLEDTGVGPRPGMPVREMLVAGAGFSTTPTGRAAFAASELSPPFSHLSLIVFVHAPAAPAGARSLARAVALLAAILISVAASVAYSFSRNARDDVDFVRKRIERMTQATAGSLGEPVPIRTFDQVGVVTSAFNSLLERFKAAERAYRHDLGQADALDRSRARFLAALSHELRTPLNAILGFADVLLSEVDGPLPPSAREDLEVIRASGEHLRALIDDILDLSAMETGSLRLDRRSVDVRRVAEQVVREAQPLLAARAGALSVLVTGEESAVAWADAKRLRQILANLVGNAVKFTPHGQVSVDVRTIDGASGARVVIEVRDTGPGIAEAEAAGIFEEYRQAGDAASRRKGTGLGLAIARRLTLMHEGSLGVRSELGKGSTFRVELPAGGGAA
jgi:signal transduction histidine kinase